MKQIINISEKASFEIDIDHLLKTAEIKIKEGSTEIDIDIEYKTAEYLTDKLYSSMYDEPTYEELEEKLIRLEIENKELKDQLYYKEAM